MPVADKKPCVWIRVLGVLAKVECKAFCALTALGVGGRIVCGNATPNCICLRNNRA